MGWYFCAIPTKSIVPAAGQDLATVALIKKGCKPQPPGCEECPPKPEPPYYPPPPPPPYPPYRPGDYPTCRPDTPPPPPPPGWEDDCHHPHPPHHPPHHPSHHPCHPDDPVEIPPEVQDTLDRAFITVDTIAQRDMLSASKLLPHGKLVKVNSTPYGEKYFSWNQITEKWDEMNFMPDLSGYVTREEGDERYVKVESAQDTFLTVEKANETFVTNEVADEKFATQKDLVDTKPTWEPII